MGWQNESAAVALAQAVSDPHSPSYGHYLTPAQFRQQFAPSQASVNAVTSWLRSQGFTVDYTPLNNHYVAAEGTLAQAAAAFGTSFGEYAVQGQLLQAPTTALSIPASLSGIVDSVVGLDDSMSLIHPDHVVDTNAPPPAAFVNAPPCSTYYGQYTTGSSQSSGYQAAKDGTSIPKAYGVYQPWVVCGYTPDQIRDAYGFGNSGLDGSDVTVAIIDAYASPTIVSDANTYFNAIHGYGKNWFSSADNFMQVVAPGTYRHPESRAQDPQGWSGEETLDVEAVHGMAPGAKIVYVGAPNNYQDLDAAMNHVVDRHLADIVTNSYGFSGEAIPRGYIKPLEDTLIQAAAEGIGVYFSSGDNGDETGGLSGVTPTPDWPASSPWVTAVGGTSLAIGQGNIYSGEVAWETTNAKLVNGAWSPAVTAASPGTWLYGGGGGISHIFAQPWYQTSAILGSLSTGMRVVPDVAAIADPQTGMLIGQTQTFPAGSTPPSGAVCQPNNPLVCYSTYRIGGTSLASPIFAGISALVDQARLAKNEPVLGFANPALYAAYAANASAFNDIAHSTTPVAQVRANYKNSVNATNGYSYYLRTTDFDGLYIHATTGYDDETGLGTPNGSPFISALTTYTKP
ncbi:MAG: S53 family peptidase [Candidatus Limnocylindrales bacterium]